MRQRLLAATVLAIALSGITGGAALAHPDNDQTLRFVLTCDDGHV
jgi:hypothetical protein